MTKVDLCSSQTLTGVSGLPFCVQFSFFEFLVFPGEDISKADKSLLNKLIRSKLVTTKNDLEILQKDPNSPLFSVKSFEALKL